MSKVVLNVGGGPSRCVHPAFADYRQVLLDIDKNADPDLCMDARELHSLKAAQFDAIYCSHMLEHVYQHDVRSVLDGFRHVLKDDGVTHISVPDVGALMQACVSGKKDIMDTWYRCSSGEKISFHDVLYGWGREMELGNLYYAHKCGFTFASLDGALRRSGFTSIYISRDGYNLIAFAFTRRPNKLTLQRLGIA